MLFKWTFDATNQTLNAPSGLKVTVCEIAHWIQDRVYNRHELTGPWAGFRVRGRWLIGPGVRITPESLRHLLKGYEAQAETADEVTRSITRENDEAVSPGDRSLGVRGCPSGGTMPTDGRAVSRHRAGLGVRRER